MELDFHAIVRGLGPAAFSTLRGTDLDLISYRRTSSASPDDSTLQGSDSDYPVDMTMDPDFPIDMRVDPGYPTDMRMSSDNKGVNMDACPADKRGAETDYPLDKADGEYIELDYRDLETFLLNEITPTAHQQPPALQQQPPALQQQPPPKPGKPRMDTEKTYTMYVFCVIKTYIDPLGSYRTNKTC